MSLPIGENDGAAPVAIISAKSVPANEVVAKLLVDLIASLPLPVCRLKAAEIDIPAELLQIVTAIYVFLARDTGAGVSSAFWHVDRNQDGMISLQPEAVGLRRHLAVALERISHTLSGFA